MLERVRSELTEEANLATDNPVTIVSRQRLAATFESEGRWADAEPLRRTILADQRQSDGPDRGILDNALAALGENLIQQRKWADAEPVLRECLGIRRTTYANAWPLFVTMSYLGESLLGLRRHADAEPLLLAGYNGLSLRRAELTGPFSRFLTEAENRIVALYKAWGKPDQARAWEVKLGLADLPADVFAPTAAAVDQRAVGAARAASSESIACQTESRHEQEFWCARCGRSYEMPRSWPVVGCDAGPAGTCRQEETVTQFSEPRYSTGAERPNALRCSLAHKAEVTCSRSDALGFTLRPIQPGIEERTRANQRDQSLQFHNTDVPSFSIERQTTAGLSFADLLGASVR